MPDNESNPAAAFKAQQERNWHELSAGWDKWYELFERGAEPVTRSLLEGAGLTAGSSVLDIGSGTGQPALAIAAQVPEGRVVGVDQAEGMLAVARRRAAELRLDNVEFLRQDAEELDVEAGAYDAVVSRWGLMFLPDADRVLHTALRALKPGGSCTVSVWGTAPQVPMLSLAFGVAAARLGLPAPPPGLPGPFSMADSEALCARFTKAGFTDVTAEEHRIVFRPQTVEEFVEFSWDLLPGWLRAKLAETFGDERDERTVQAVATAAREFESDGGGLAVPCVAHCVRAVKPS
ncbi:class I SAM-dependent methyltransferase [Streptomyces broussonetiae]|uniref:Methyltransferase domain-containing protein n=1 Tax=Streptomyces broussonetiae TaxID=2686304 RepID=A0A6I6N6B0_9ACTN|nr:class I SAM-dependent methyltransferase [Streptomyces broussonetiae]QHA04455.1 methyltransferase domain-containing protein [Streptomyces broussonetiae]